MRFSVESWADELSLTLVDASSKRERAEPLGRVRLRLADLVNSHSDSRVAASVPTWRLEPTASITGL